MAEAKRTVRVGSMAYVDPTGRTRRADCGAEVSVHPDDVERFDLLNVLPGDPAPAEPQVAAKSRRTKAAGNGGG
ncbi:hypothetical protein ACXYTP_23425 [Tsukamurella ocularis]